MSQMSWSFNKQLPSLVDLSLGLRLSLFSCNLQIPSASRSIFFALFELEKAKRLSFAIHAMPPACRKQVTVRRSCRCTITKPCLQQCPAVGSHLVYHEHAPEATPVGDRQLAHFPGLKRMDKVQGCNVTVSQNNKKSQGLVRFQAAGGSTPTCNCLQSMI